MTKRRRPQQARAVFTVDAILDAVSRVLREDGSGAVTTNRVATVAGVSIGTLYQYFSNKQEIFDALHERSFSATVARVNRILEARTPRTLEDLVRDLFRAVVEVRSEDVELQRLLATTVPRGEDSRAEGDRLTESFRNVVLKHRQELSSSCDLNRFVFVLAHMMGGLSSAVVLSPPTKLGHEGAAQAAEEALVTYVRQHLASECSA